MDDGLAATMRLADQTKQLKSAIDGFGSSLLSGLLNGEKGFAALEGAAKQFISTLAGDTLKRVQNGGSLFGNQQLGSAAGGVAMLSAGAAGYQSGSPLAGALGGAMAGAAFGPYGMAAGAVIGGVAGIFGASAKKNQQAAADRAAAAQRAGQYNMTAQLAGIDTGTREGALTAFDIQAANARLQEAAQKYPQMAALEAQLAAQRLAIQKQFNDQMIAESKKILDYLEGLKTGPNSILNPQDQLAAAQSNFNAQLAKAQGGDFAAIQGITQVAQTLLDQAQKFFASGAGYADVYNQVTGSLQGVAGRAAQGLAGGGFVGNGIYGVDSVRARYAGGGDIMLAGGEFVSRAGSVNASTMPTLDHINRTGSLPVNDNAAHFENLTRVVAQGANATIAALTSGLAALDARLKRLDDTAREGAAQQRKQKRDAA
jgi:hypothetical protein